MKCALLGCTPEIFNFQNHGDDRELLQYMRVALLEMYMNNCMCFMSGLKRGCEIWMAELLIILRDTYPCINLRAVLPYRGYKNFNTSEELEQFKHVSSHCNSHKIIKNCAAPDATEIYDDFYRAEADIVFAVYSKKYPDPLIESILRTAKELNKPHIVMDPFTYRITRHCRPKYWHSYNEWKKRGFDIVGVVY